MKKSLPISMKLNIKMIEIPIKPPCTLLTLIIPLLATTKCSLETLIRLNWIEMKKTNIMSQHPMMTSMKSNMMSSQLTIMSMLSLDLLTTNMWIRNTPSSVIIFIIR